MPELNKLREEDKSVEEIARGILECSETEDLKYPYRCLPQIDPALLQRKVARVAKAISAERAKYDALLDNVQQFEAQLLSLREEK